MLASEWRYIDDTFVTLYFIGLITRPLKPVIYPLCVFNRQTSLELMVL